jgi:pyoverdine/dityrosine biosynthesis protein Dit1
MENIMLVEKSHVVSDEQDWELAHRIIVELFTMRRLLPDEQEKTEYQAEIAPHFPKVLKAIQAGQELQLILPAFPAKSPSRRKTLGHLPDHGEELALRNVNRLCERITAMYPPGCRIIVCSDGRVFADIVRVSDRDVTEYNTEIRRLVKVWGLAHIDFFDLDDVYPGVKDFSILREELMVTYGESLASLQQRCRTELEARAMYNGIARFLFEDFFGLDEFSGMSRTAVRDVANLAAYRVIQRSNAWGRLLAERTPQCLRLSIHPQFRVAEKIGINLIGITDCWSTPWHSVVLMRGENISLVPRVEAEKMNASLIYRDGRPSHYHIAD